MDPRLQEAASKGDLASLHLLTNDPNFLKIILDYPTEGMETPLHIALLRGHVIFAAEILQKNPSLAQIPNQKGSYPLHLASARGHEGIVEKLLEMEPSLSLLRDKEGRTPLHSAALNGQIGVLEKLYPAHKNQRDTNKMLDGDENDGGEPILHFCMKHNQIEAAKYLAETDEALVKMTDKNGNTILHIAVARKNKEMVQFLLDRKKHNVNVYAKNMHGFTALDIAKSDKNAKEITEVLQPWKNYLWNSWDNWHKKDEIWAKDMHNTLMLVTTIILTVTFQAGLSPPGGVWSDKPDMDTSPSPSPMPPSHAPPSDATMTAHIGNIKLGEINSNRFLPGTAIHNVIRGLEFKLFMYCNMVAFATSLTIILSLVSGFPLKRRITTWMLVISVWAALSSLTLAFVFGTKTITVSEKVLKKIPCILYVWLGLMVLLLLSHCIILVFRFVDKIKKSDKIMPWDKFKKLSSFMVDKKETSTKDEVQP